MAMVRREGCPGPEPTNRIRPFLFGVVLEDSDWEELLVCEGAFNKEDM